MTLDVVESSFCHGNIIRNRTNETACSPLLGSNKRDLLLLLWNPPTCQSQLAIQFIENWKKNGFIWIISNRTWILFWSLFIELEVSTLFVKISLFQKVNNSNKSNYVRENGLMLFVMAKFMTSPTKLISI